MPSRLWYHPRHLLHFDGSQAVQMITYRLADSLPREVINRRSDEIADGEERYRTRIDHSLDGGFGSCVLRDPRIAKLVIEAWQHFDGQRYHLHAWVVMPNHVHVVIANLGCVPLASIVQSWKSFTTRSMRQLVPRATGWQRDYWDRYIRDEGHYYAAVRYVHHNPVVAGLVAKAEDWRWSSAWVGQEGAS